MAWIALLFFGSFSMIANADSIRHRLAVTVKLPVLLLSNKRVIFRVHRVCILSIFPQNFFDLQYGFIFGL